MRITFLSVFLLVALFLSGAQAQDQARIALDDARRFAKSGQYEYALERHVWFHNNACRIDPGYRGVRLSFALMNWVELGKKYPKAMEKLKSIKKNKTSRLYEGEFDLYLFQDVATINRYIGEIESTVELFKHFDQVDTKFAESIYCVADEDLFKFEEYSLSRKYLGNPMDRLDLARRQYQSGIKFAVSKGNHIPTREAYENIFKDEVKRIVIILDKNGERELALKIQSEALKIFDNPEIHNLI